MIDQVALAAWRCRYRPSVGTGRAVAVSILFNLSVLPFAFATSQCPPEAGHKPARIG
ncbi:MAG: hypothetical protein ACK4FW_10005 [Stenotrophomonas sp.]